MTRLFFLAAAATLFAGCFSQPPAPAVDRSGTPQATATQPSGPGYYTVRRGDTLYRIAMDHGQDYRELAAWNNIANPSAIREGQILRVAPPSTAAVPAGGVQTTPVNVGSGVEVRALDAPAAAAESGGLLREPRVAKEPYSDEAHARLSRQAEQPRSPEPTAAPAVPAPAVAAAPAPAPVAGPDEVPWIWPSAGRVIAGFSEAGNKGLDFAGKAGDPVIAAGEGKVVYAGSGLRGYGELVIIKHNATYLSAYAHNRRILVKEGQQVSRGQKIAEMGSTDADSVKLHFEIRKQGKPVDPALYLPKR